MNYSKKILIALIISMISVILLSPGMLNADTISVPGDYSTIQEAINNAGDGDTINIGPGTYYENLSILLESETLYLVGSGSSSTIINGGGSGIVINTAHSGGGPDDDVLILRNMTITNGDSGTGGGINSSIFRTEIYNCSIKDNHANTGGGIYGSRTVIIEDSNISNNRAACGFYGGGIAIMGSSASFTINDSVISNNSAGDNSIPNAQGGGIYISGGSLVMRNSSITGNTIQDSSGSADNGITFYSSLDAINNWWGSSSGPYNPTLNPSGGGDSVLGDVSIGDIYPWLTYNPFASGSGDDEEEESVWIRDREMTCFQVWINEDNNFEFVFWWEYANNNWVKIYDMDGMEVFSIDMEKGSASFEAGLPDGMYTVRTFHDDMENPIQEFIIGKP